MKKVASTILVLTTTGSINTVHHPFAVKIFPNLAADFIHFLPPGPADDPYTVTLYNSLGEPVITERNHSGALSMDTGTFGPGIYLWRARSKNGSTKSGKIIIK